MIKLTRFKYNNNFTLGILDVKGDKFLTLENPYKNNEINKSCIPTGLYCIFKRFSPSKQYNVIEIEDVIDRTYIQFHIGNTSEDSKGCILVGNSIDIKKGFLGNSTDAFNKFIELAEDEQILMIESH
ncbi:MAG: DUF5675 family protein [Clostridiales bacterium]|nr:DUF5675 family protein [Clostridiales bacterium]